jgi:hypothetical protein
MAGAHGPVCSPNVPQSLPFLFLQFNDFATPLRHASTTKTIHNNHHVHYSVQNKWPHLFSPHLFDTAPSPHRRINAPSWLLAFAHTQGEAGTPTGGVGGAVVGRNSPVLCAGWVINSVYVCKMTPVLPHLFDTAPSCRISLLVRALVCKSATADHLCEEF